MADQCTDTLRCNPHELRQAMSIHTRKITDSCRDKDCIEDLPVYLTAGSQRALDGSANTRVRCAELLSTYIDVEPVTFDRNHYCVDITFYYRILADTIIGANQSVEEPVSIAKVKEMVDAAIAKAGKGGRKIGRKLSGRQVDRMNRIILYEKDFEL